MNVNFVNASGARPEICACVYNMPGLSQSRHCDGHTKIIGIPVNSLKSQSDIVWRAETGMAGGWRLWTAGCRLCGVVANASVKRSSDRIRRAVESAACQRFGYLSRVVGAGRRAAVQGLSINDACEILIIVIAASLRHETNLLKL